MTHTLRLPRVHGPATAPTGQGNACSMTPLAQLYGAGWMKLLGADAEIMYCDARIVIAAQEQAEFLARYDFQEGDPHRGYFGSTANERVKAAGYSLPWGKGNQVESAQRIWRKVSEVETDAAFAARAAQTLAEHSTHRDHMMRLGWFREHVVWGVGMAEATIERGGYFFVVCSAPIEES